MGEACVIPALGPAVATAVNRLQAGSITDRMSATSATAKAV